MTSQAQLKKLIPKVLQAEDDAITEKKVRYIKDDEIGHEDSNISAIEIVRF